VLIVAVTGPIGAGKSTALLEFAQLALHRLTLDGFVAVAGERDVVGRGASTYDVHFMSGGQTLPFAQRAAIGYSVDSTTSAALRSWADTLGSDIDVVIMDEFGRWEADGNGHWPLWEAIRMKRPRMVVLGVRQDSLSAIEARIGHPFDLVIPAGPEASVTLLDVAMQRPDWERVGKFGAGAGVLEATVGAALHTIKFPLTGMAMSSAQAAVLTVTAERLERRSRTFWVSSIASGLKALSPSGSKLGPMLAIAMQGLLYTASITILGWNMLGAFVGGALMGAWASSQGFFVQYLMLGNGIGKAYDEVVRWVAGHLHLQLPSLPVAFGIVVGVNALLAGTVAATFWRSRHRYEDRFDAWMAARQPLTRRRSRWKAALGLGLPTLIVVAILLSSGTAWSEAALIVGRALGVTLLLFALVQRWRPAALIGLLAKRGKWGPAYALRSALEDRPQKS